MKFGLEARRIGYRVAYHLLVSYWFIRRAELHGVKCALTDQDRILLVRHTYGPRGWDFPGGGIKRGEQPLGAARREIEEELGLRIDNWRSLGELVTDVYRSRDTLHCFHAEVDNPQIRSNPVEIDTFGWFARDSLPSSLGRFAPDLLKMLTSSLPSSAEASRPGTSRNP
jgi:8-oxo-dGTP pyrophosphatase MutT (NUDIX family)